MSDKTTLQEQLRSKLSHDLRSKINVVLGYCEMVSEEVAALGADQAVEDLATIRRACEDLLLTNEEIRTLLSAEAAPESGAGDLARLGSLVQPIDDEIARIAGASPLTLTGDLEASVPAGLERSLGSIVRKAALAFPAGAGIEFEADEQRLVMSIRPDSITASTLDGFVSRYAAGANPDPRTDFDLFFALEIAEVEGVGIGAEKADLDQPAARITLSWS